MRTKAVIILLCLILLPTICSAELFLSRPRVGKKSDYTVELGSSPEITLKFKNTLDQDVEVASVDVFLTYDPSIVQLIGIINKNPNYLIVRAQDTYRPGQIRYKITTSSKNPKPLPAWPNRVLDLATIVFHVNQSAQAGSSERLFNWSGQGTSLVLDPQGYDLTGERIVPQRTHLEGSKAPEFRGLNQVVSANTLGDQNPGNTLILDWRTAAGAFDRTKYYDGKLSYRVWRRTANTQWQEISGQQPTHAPGTDPFDRYPYVGNTNIDYIFEDKGLNDGQTYSYKVTAIDDTSPEPNEQTETAIINGVPLDLTPPGEVRALKTSVGDRQITLSWDNPREPDLGGVLLMVSESGPIAEGALGHASTTGNGPEYQPGDQPFGEGKGYVMYVSTQVATPQVIEQYADTYATNALRTYYKVFTFDQATNGPPRQFGRNYSKGVPINDAAGIAPRPIMNFKAEVGEYPGEVLLLWNNSLDNFTAGTLVKFDDNDKTKFTALTDQRAGKLVEAFPVYGQPGELDGYYIAGFPTNKTYYFKAFAYNQGPEPLDPMNPDTMTNYKFSSGKTAAVYLPIIEAEAAETGIRPASNIEPVPELKIWFNNRLYRQALVDKGIKFYVPPRPRIKVEATIPQPYKLDQNQANYSFNIDGNQYSYKYSSIKANQVIFEDTLSDALTPGEHTFTFSAQSSGDQATSTSASKRITVIATSGELRILDRPLSFPNPFNPARNQNISFQYTLDGPAENGVDIYIFDISGKIIKKIMVAPGDDGTLAQLNKVSWDGKTDQGGYVSSGQYLANIVSKGEKKPLGKVKFTVYR